MEKRGVLGIDIGGRSFKMKIYDTKGKIHTQHFAISNFSKEDLLAIMFKTREKYGIFDMIGVSQAGEVQNNTLIACKRHPLLNGLSGNWFQENHLCSTAKIINDAQAVAVYGHEITKSDNIAALIIGTGLGCSLWKKGNILSNIGKFNNINNFPVNNTILGKCCASIAIHTDEEKEWVLSHLEDPCVVRKIETAARYFSYAINIVDKNLKPDTIFVSGGVSQFPNYFHLATQMAHTNAKIELCKNAEFAGCDGAIAYATT